MILKTFFLLCALSVFIGCIRSARSIRAISKDKSILSVSNGSIWYSSSVHQVCLHVIISVPFKEVKSLTIHVRMVMRKYGKNYELGIRFCDWANQNEINDITTYEVQLVACTNRFSNNITSGDTVILDGLFDLRIRHWGPNSQHWSSEKHSFPQGVERFVEVIDSPAVNFCNNQTLQDSCKF